MYTPGMLINMSDSKYGLVLETKDTYIKYLSVTPDLKGVNSNLGIYPLTKDSFHLGNVTPEVVYIHLDTICIADGEFDIVGGLNNNKELINVLSTLNGFRNYTEKLKETSNDITITIEEVEEPVVLRKTV